MKQDTPFINRDCDKRVINRLIDSTNVLLIASYTGVGKSALLDHLMSTQMTDKKHIRIKITGHNNFSSQNLYFNNLFWEIDTFAKKTGSLQSFEGFLLKNKNKFTLVSKIWDNFSGMNITEFIETYFLPSSTYSPNIEMIELQKEYILEFLSKSDIIIHIDNIQTIDNNSLTLLFDIIRKSSNTLFFFEYMFDNLYNSNTLLKLIEDFKYEGIRPEQHTLDMFKENHFKLFCEAHNYNAKFQELYKIYSTHNGNFLQAKSLQNNYFRGQSTDAILDAIDQLSPNSLNILALISIKDNSIELSDIYDLILSDRELSTLYTDSDIDASIAELKKHNMIELVNNYVLLVHDSIKDKIVNEKRCKVHLMIAFSVIERQLSGKLQYIDDFSTENRKFKEQLISLYLNYSPEKLLTKKEIQMIQNLSLSYRKRDFAIDYLKKIESYIDDSNSTYMENLTLILVNAFYVIGAFEKALSSLDKIYSSSNETHVAYKALILSRYDEISNALNFIDKALASSNYSDYTIFKLKLCKIIVLIINSKYNQKNILIDSLLENDHYKDYREYGYVLKLCEERFNNEESIDYIERAIDHFNNHSDYIEVYKTRITLAAQYGNIGKVKEAYDQLMIAKKGLSNRVLETRNINNNIGICEFLLGQNYIMSFKTALSLTSSTMNTLMISNNLFATLCMSDDYDSASAYVSLLENSGSNFEYASIRITTNFNLYQYYYDQKNTIDANRFKQLCIDDLDNVDEERQYYWRCRLNKSGYNAKGFSRVFREKYHLSFMSIWDFHFYNS